MSVANATPGRPLTDVLFEDATVGRCLVAPDGTIARVNAEWLRSTGFTEAQVVGEDVVELFPADRDRALAMHAQARAGHRVEVPRRAQVVDGRETWWEGSVEPVAMERGIGLLVTAREVPPREPSGASAAEMHRAEARLRLQASLLDRAGDAVVSTDADFRVTTWNKAAERSYGFTEAEALGRRLDELLRTERPGGSAPSPDIVGADPVTVEVVHHDKWGGRHHVQASVVALFDGAGRVEGTLGVLRDVTSLRRAEKALRQSEQLLRQLAETMPQVVWAARPDGTVDYCNSRVGELVGAQLNGDGTWTWKGLVHPDDAAATLEAWNSAMRTGRPYEATYRVRRRSDGAWRWHLARAEPARDAEGRIVRWFGFNADIHVQKQAAQEIQEARSILTAALASMTDAVMISDANGRFIHLNEGCATFHRFGSKDECAKTCAEYPDLLDTFFANGTPAPVEDWAASRALRGETATNAVYRLRRKDTGESWIGSYSFAPIRDDRGAIVGAVVVGRDITESERAKEALRLTQASVDVAAEMIARFTPDGRLRYANDATCRTLGYSREELLNLTAMDFSPGFTWEQYAENWREARDKRSLTLEVVHRRKDGSTYPAEVTLNHVVYGGQEYIFAYGRDITDRKRSEQAVRDSEARLRAFVQSDVVGILFGDVDGRVYDCNEELARIIGRPREEVLAGKVRWTEITPPEDLPLDEAAIAEARATGRCRPYEKRYIRPDGTRVPIHVGYVLLEPDRTRSVAFILDITERKAAEDELREADRRKDEFLGMLSHELRNPLAPIRSSTYLLRHAAPGSEQARRAQTVIERQVDHMTRLVDDLLDVTRIARGKIELRRSRVDLRDVIARAAEDFRGLLNDQGVRFDLVISGEELQADADATRITQIVGNLLHNSTKFTRRGDTVALSIEASGDAAEVRVRDTGAGIDRELLPRIFEAFTQGERTLARTDGGLGLGLALVKGLAELHGGSVEARSGGNGTGSEFIVRLPLSSSLEAPADEAPRAALRSGGRRCVLVVDDNRDAAESLADIVEMLGHAAEVAFDGPSAIERARAIAPDLVLCDIGLPGMSGYDVARVLRAELDRDVRLVAISGYAQPEDVQKAREAGFDEHLAKPVDPREIERLLG